MKKRTTQKEDTVKKLKQLKLCSKEVEKRMKSFSQRKGKFIAIIKGPGVPRIPNVLLKSN